MSADPVNNQKKHQSNEEEKKTQDSAVKWREKKGEEKGVLQSLRIQGSNLSENCKAPISPTVFLGFVIFPNGRLESLRKN